MEAIIVPGVTDLNKGDQALVWESYRIIQDTGLFSKISVLSNGDSTEEYNLLCGQTKAKGIRLLHNVLKHPRRGKHNQDEAINEGALSLAFQIFNAVGDYLSRSLLLKLAKRSKLQKFFFNTATRETITSFANANTIFMKGGGFIHAHGEKTAPYVMWYLLFYVNLAKRLGKNVVILPNSYGPFDGLGVKSQVRESFKNLNLILARENISANELAKLLNRPITISSDLGFYLQASEKIVGKKVLERYQFTSDDKVIGITIRPWRFPGLDNPTALFQKYIESVKQLALYLIDNGYKVAFFNQSLGPNAHEDDRNAIQYLLKEIGPEKQQDFTWVNENFTCEDLKSIYSNLYFFVGTRFHSVIFSMTSLVPSIAIGYGGNKAMGIMKDFDLMDYIIHINDVTPDDLIHRFDNAINNYSSIKEKLKIKVTELEQRRAELVGLINNSIR